MRLTVKEVGEFRKAKGEAILEDILALLEGEVTEWGEIAQKVHVRTDIEVVDSEGKKVINPVKTEPTAI